MVLREKKAKIKAWKKQKKWLTSSMAALTIGSTVLPILPALAAENTGIEQQLAELAAKKAELAAFDLADYEAKLAEYTQLQNEYQALIAGLQGKLTVVEEVQEEYNSLKANYEIELRDYNAKLAEHKESSEIYAGYVERL